MIIEQMSAIDLQREIDREVRYAEESGPELLIALKEVQRLRIICQDIVDIINTDPMMLDESDFPYNAISKIEDKAQEYYKPVAQS